MRYLLPNRSIKQILQMWNNFYLMGTHQLVPLTKPWIQLPDLGCHVTTSIPPLPCTVWSCLELKTSFTHIFMPLVHSNCTSRDVSPYQIFGNLRNTIFFFKWNNRLVLNLKLLLLIFDLSLSLFVSSNALS